MVQCLEGALFEIAIGECEKDEDPDCGFCAPCIARKALDEAKELEKDEDFGPGAAEWRQDLLAELDDLRRMIAGPERKDG